MAQRHDAEIQEWSGTEWFGYEGLATSDSESGQNCKSNLSKKDGHYYTRF